MVKTATTLPRTIPELTPDWFSDALSQTHPGTVCTDLEVGHIEWGTATKVRVRVEYASDTGVPNDLCVKGVFSKDDSDHALSEINAMGAQAEARFFGELASTADLPVPRHWYAGVDSEQGIVVMDDLVSRGARFGDPKTPWSTDQVAAGLSTLAAQHGRTWGASFSQVPWMTVGATVVRGAATALFSDQHWAAHFGESGPVSLPDSLRDNARDLRGFQALWELDDRSELCLSHSDAHVGNTYIEPDGAVYFLDWASPALAPWSSDVAYFIAGALDIDERRSSERELLGHYLCELATHGAPELDTDTAWAEYRRHLMHGLIWVAVPAAMQSAESVATMSERYATAIEDHDVFEMLTV